MDIISGISKMYKGNIRLHPPYTGVKPDRFPEDLYSLLCVSNGIEEMMTEPDTGENIAISWIVYPYDLVLEDTSFYHSEYGIEGCVFSTNGAGDPFIMKQDGSITIFDGIDGKETRAADSLAGFFGP